jgi:predicted transcriptional regulator
MPKRTACSNRDIIFQKILHNIFNFIRIDIFLIAIEYYRYHYIGEYSLIIQPKKGVLRILMPPMLSKTSRNPRVSSLFSAVELFKRIDDWTLYQLIDKHPGESVYALSKAIGWSTTKVYASVERLAADGLVRTETSVRSGRSALIVSPREWQEFFTPAELDEIKNLNF